MYKIREDEWKEKQILLIPAMLDAHFPLLKYAFYSKNYHPVVLENEAKITDTGLQYVNNDFCYPGILISGQMINALRSGSYDLSRTVLLMPQAGDACRGSNYTGMLRRAVANAGFPDIKVLALNVKGLERGQQMKIEPAMVWRAMFSVFYGDLLMILSNQVRPYEVHAGETDACLKKWTDYFAENLKSGTHLTLSRLNQNMKAVCLDFANIKRQKKTLQKIGVVGELYTKYCHLGNWNLERFLREEGCEYYINGVTWYVLYYIDTHLTTEGRFVGGVYRIGLSFLGALQKRMVRTVKEHGFYIMEEFPVFKEKAKEFVNYNCATADGWLIGAEAAGHIRNGYKKVIAVQPFDCMPNHVCGRGLYPSLQRKQKDGQIVSIDVDASGSSLNVRNRLKLLLDFVLP